MSDLSAFSILLPVLASVIGVVIGWFLRGKRSEHEKKAINAGWQEQFGAKSVEHRRLVDQNRSLMDQINQHQASGNDAKLRTAELSDALKEALQRRDELQREVKDIKAELDTSNTDRREMRSDIFNRAAQYDSLSKSIATKDERIAKLNRELESWQNRVPPLVERFRQRNQEAQQLEQELEESRRKVTDLEQQLEEASHTIVEIDPTETRVEPVSNSDSLTGGHDASNEPMDNAVNDDSSAPDFSDLEDDLNGSAIHESLHDDLQLIKGVGPAIEKTLHEMGIYRFRQIADMSEYDIDRVANRLKGFRTRVYREDWIGQARALYDAKLSR